MKPKNRDDILRKKEYHDRMKKLSIHHSIYCFVIST
jgi:hypothetical protein